MDIGTLFAKALTELNITIQELERAGYRNEESPFGKIAREIFDQNTNKDRLLLYVNFKQNRNCLKDQLIMSAGHTTYELRQNQEFIHSKSRIRNEKDSHIEVPYSNKFQICTDEEIISQRSLAQNTDDEVLSELDLDFGNDSSLPFNSTTGNIIINSNPPVPTKLFSFELTAEEWKTIKPIKGRKCLTPSWCNIFASKIANYNPLCVFNFYYNHISHITSRKRNCQYFQGRGRCKITTCQATIKISISKKEVTKGNPKVNVTTYGELSHLNFTLDISLEKNEQRQQKRSQILA